MTRGKKTLGSAMRRLRRDASSVLKDVLDWGLASPPKLSRSALSNQLRSHLGTTALYAQYGRDDISYEKLAALGQIVALMRVGSNLLRPESRTEDVLFAPL